MQTH
jgi:hypothetical protein